MSVKRGAIAINAIKKGAISINAIKKGSVSVWSPITGFGVFFDGPDAFGLTGWVVEEATDEDYIGSVVGQMARMYLPDDLLDSVSEKRSWQRYDDETMLSDDGFVECQIGNHGSPTYITQVFRRVSNASFDDGVGIDLRNSMVSIVRRVSGVDSVVKPAVTSFVDGDVIRLDQVGNVHTIYRNGVEKGTPWTDSGNTAAMDSGHRSIGLRLSGAKPALNPRRFSPGLTYIKAS